MRKERESSLKEIFKIALAEAKLELKKLYLDYDQYMRSRKGAIIAGTLSGLAVIIGDWKSALMIAGGSILYKASEDIESGWEEQVKKSIEKTERELEKLK